MSTAVSEKRARKGGSSATARMKRALKMYRGKLGKDAYTLYHASTIDRANDEKRDLLVVNESTQKLVLLPWPHRRCHRQFLTDTYSDYHDKAGQGKYIDPECVHGKEIEGADQLNPYLGIPGIRYTLIEALKRDIGLSTLRDLEGIQKRSADLGPCIKWEDDKNEEGFILASRWFPIDEDLLERCYRLSSVLRKSLRDSRSGRADVKNPMSMFGKFVNTIHVIARSRWHLSVSTGDLTPSGGRYPYGVPLEQFGMALDLRHMTYHVYASGDEAAQPYIRLVYGRTERHVLTEREWIYESINSPYAYLNASVQQKAQKIHEAVQAKQALRRSA